MIERDEIFLIQTIVPSYSAAIIQNFWYLSRKVFFFT